MNIRFDSRNLESWDAAKKICAMLSHEALCRSGGIVFKAALAEETETLVFECLPGEIDGRGNVHDDMSVAPHEDSAVIGWIADTGAITLLCKITRENFEGTFREPFKSRIKAGLASVARLLSDAVSLVPRLSGTDSTADGENFPNFEIDWATTKFLKEAGLVTEPFSTIADILRILGSPEGWN